MNKDILPPVEVSYCPPPRLDTLEEQTHAAARQRQVSATIGVLGALLVHLLLVAIFMVIAMGVLEKELPPLVVAIEGYDPEQQVETPEFNTRVTQRPSSPSARSATSIATASAVARVSAPEVDRAEIDPLEFRSGLEFDHGIGSESFVTGHAGVQFMGIRGGGGNIILVIDTSGSMPTNCKANGILAIRREINKTINGFTESTRFNIICYADAADAFRPASVLATKANKAKAMRFMKGYFKRGPGTFGSTRTQSYGGSKERGATDPSGIAYLPIYPDSVAGLEGTSGGSRIDLGVVAAMERKPSTIFVLSDGEPLTRRNNRPLSQDELVEIITANYTRIYMGTKLSVHTISIGELGSKFLGKVSGAFQGQHKKINPFRL